MPTIDPHLPASDRLSAPEAVAPATISPAERAKVEHAAEKFESMFIGEMFKQMRRTTREFAGEDGMFKDRINSDMLELADVAVADAMAGQRAFGIADAILRQLLPPANPAAALAPTDDKR